MKHPDNLKDFMVWFKDQSEKHFATLEVDMDASGLQHQKGTKWKPGLSDEELQNFQQELGFDFPSELTEFYRVMNGTDLPGVNVYSGRGYPYQYAPIYYSYPDDLTIIKQLINERLQAADLTIEQMKTESIPNIFPVNDFYYIVSDGKTNPIYYLTVAHRKHDINKPYVYGEHYADTLQSWLIKNVFHQTEHISDLIEFPDRQRTGNYWTT